MYACVYVRMHVAEARSQLASTATEGMPPRSTKLWNQIHVHRASQRSLNFAAQLVQQNRQSGHPTNRDEGS